MGGVLADDPDFGFDGTFFVEIAAIGACAGAAWCTGFCLKANSFVRQAKAMNTYSVTIFEDEVLRVGDTTLMAGVNLMNNRMANAHGLGLSLKLNF